MYIYTSSALDKRINCRSSNKKYNFSFSLAIKTLIKQIKKQKKYEQANRAL